MLRALGLSLVVSLALCSPAGAAPFTPALERAYGVAERYWGGGPVDCLSLDRQIVPDDSLPEGAEGWATIPVEPTACVLYVERRLAKPTLFPRACGILIHELGHLRGMGHSEVPGDVMHPAVVKPPAICIWAGIAELNR